MAAIKVPYFVWRDGRPRWVPGPKLRAKGFKGQDLKDPAGNWLSEAAAIEAARALNIKVDEWRTSGKPRRSAVIPRRHPRSCESLYEEWVDSPGFKRKSSITQRDYKSKARIFLDAKIDDIGTFNCFGDAPATAIRANHLYAYWEEIYKSRGHSMANGTLAVIRAMFSHALPKRLDWRTDNPASKLGLEGVEPRVETWSPSEVARFIEVADEIGLPCVADAVIIALHTGQRQSDVLQLQHAKSNTGRAIFRQGKTGARVSVPFTPALEERLTKIRARRPAGEVVDLARPLIVSARTGEPYKVDYFRKRFAEVRTVAAKGSFKSLASKQFLDLRDTAVTRLALAGCTVAEIRAITGHTLETVHKVLKHYLALDDRMADAGIAKLKNWMAEEGIAV